MSDLVLDHVGIAVHSIEAAIPTYERLTGGGHEPPIPVPGEGVRVAFVGTGPGRLELLEPTSPDSPIARFLERRGPGVHHLAYRVGDLDAALARYRAAGFEQAGAGPRRGAHGHRVAFLHPRSTGGVLIELVEAPPEPRAP